MGRKSMIFMGLLIFVLLTGCAGKMIINLDSAPIPNHEYVANNSRAGITVRYILVRYFKKYYGDEYLIEPEFLNAWDEQVIDPSKTESLVLHVKVLNQKQIKYMAWYELAVQAGEENSFDVKNLYIGKLPRKEFAIRLPIGPNRKVKYRLTFDRPGGKRIHEIGFPYLSYTTKKGGMRKNNTSNITR